MQVNADYLRAGLSLLGHSLGSGRTVTMKTTEDALLLTSSGLASSVRVWLPRSEDDNIFEGSVLHATLATLAQIATGDTVDINLASNGKKLAIKTGPTTTTTLAMGTIRDWPLTSEKANGEKFTLPLTDLVTAIRRVEWATSDKQANLSAIEFLIEEDGNLTTAATDSFGFAANKLQIPNWTAGPISLFLPPIGDLLEKMEITENMIAGVILVDQKMVVMTAAGGMKIEVIFNTMDVKFPEWRKRLPSTGTTLVMCDLNTLRSFVNKVIAICDPVWMTLAFTADAIAVKATSETVTHVDHMLAQVQNPVQGFTIRLQPKLLRTALNALANYTGAEGLGLALTKDTAPVLIKTPGYDVTMFIMPMAKAIDEPLPKPAKGKKGKPTAAGAATATATATATAEPIGSSEPDPIGTVEEEEGEEANA